MLFSAARIRNNVAILAVGAGTLLSGTAPAGTITFSVGGDGTTASIQNTVDSFRAALGDPNNANAPGPLAAGRREINWDGGGSDSTTTPAVTPFNLFINSRGSLFTTPGTGLTQATPSGGLALINATYGSTFSTFSPLRLFAPVGSNIIDVFFFLPGSNGTIAATVDGFGAVFTDVDLANSAQIEYFNTTGDSLFKSFVPAGTVADGSLSFLGVLFDAGEQIARVRITTGNMALGPTDNPIGGVDVVALDDVLYREPTGVTAVPEPATLALLAFGLAGIGFSRRRH